MIQITLVSLYGNKNAELTKFITDFQQIVKSELGEAFFPYDVGQVHATIIGLERRIGSPLHNLNFWKFKGRQVEMDHDGFLSFLRNGPHIPFSVQIGGFQDRDYPFLSDPFEKGKEGRPFGRSFSIQGDKVVIMGWPLRGKPLEQSPSTPANWAQENRIYPPTLDNIRNAAQKFGLLHAYHRTATAVDNDFFFRIGLVDIKSKSPDSIAEAVLKIREGLSSRPPLIVQITLDDLYIAAYEDEKLPLKTTQVWSVADQSVTGKFIADLYQ